MSASMPTLPEGLKPYFRTLTFDEGSAPEALQRDHTTKDGTWARIVIESGSLVYRIQEGKGGVFTLTPGTDGVVQPHVPHAIELVGPVRFHVEFLTEAARAAELSDITR